MKPPAWIVPVGDYELSPDGKEVVITFRVRRWHPGLWLHLLRHLRFTRHTKRPPGGPDGSER